MKRLFRPIMSVFFVMVLLQSVLPLPVYALTTTKAVTGDGTDSSGTYGGGTSDWNNINSDDNGTSYIEWYGACGSTFYKSWNTADISGAGRINSVSMTYDGTMCCGAYVWVTYTPYALIGGTRYYGSAQAAYGGGIWPPGQYTKVWSTSPATGVAWTEAEYNAAEFGVKVDYCETTWARVSYVIITIGYDAVTVPSVTTSVASSVTATSATLNGSITNNGYATITNYGFVWGTADAGDPGAATAPTDGAGGWTKGWTVGAGSYSPIPYSITHATGATLTHGTTYYFRAAALNSVGWTYGSTLSFATFDHSVIAISSATDVVSTTATLQSQLTTSGGDPATEVEFAYTSTGTPATYAAIIAGAHLHATATGYWATGSFPSAPITGLTASTFYTFAASSKNTVDVAYGTIVSGVSTFTTESGVYIPTNLVAIPTSTTISLSWVKGVGAAQTSVRYSDGGYPADYNSPTSIYLGTGNSYQLTGLTPGTTYYFSAWGYTAGVYSGTAPAYTNGKITVMSTTLAYNAPSSTPTPNTITVAPSNSQWNQTPDATKASNIPVIGGLITNNANAYGQPENMMWYFVWMVCSSAIGVIVFNKSNSNLTLSLFVTCFATGAGMVIGLTMMWVIALMLLIGAGFSMFANRY
jgi:hypothetical protein